MRVLAATIYKTGVFDNIFLPNLVTTKDDLHVAIQHGVDGVIISNHGGRQLDTTPASIDILREVAPFAKGKIRLAMDGGVHRGSDIFKAIALGAEFVFVGKIAIWGLAVRLPALFPLYRHIS